MPRKPSLKTLINQAKKQGWSDRIVTKADERALREDEEKLDAMFFQDGGGYEPRG